MGHRGVRLWNSTLGKGPSSGTQGPAGSPPFGAGTLGGWEADVGCWRLPAVSQALSHPEHWLAPCCFPLGGAGIINSILQKGKWRPGEETRLAQPGLYPGCRHLVPWSSPLPLWSPHLPPPPATLASTLSLQLPRPTAIYSFVLSLSFLIRKSGVKMMTCAPPTFPPRALFPCLSPVQMLRH